MVFDRQDFDFHGEVIMGRTSFEPPYKASQIMHNEARFVHVVNGNSKLYVPNQKIDLRKTDSFIMKCESFVNSWSKNKDGEATEVIVIRFVPALLKEVYAHDMPGVFSSPKTIDHSSPVEKIECNDMITHYVNSLRYYFNNPEMMTEDLLKIKFRELVQILLNSDSQGRLKSILNNLFVLNEYGFKDIIHAHLYEDLSVSDLAFFTNLSLSSFKRKFKQIFGTSPAQYIKLKRLEKAENLLITTNQRVSDIAFDCGFNDLAYFSKAFNAFYKLSPSEYRKKQLS